MTPLTKARRDQRRVCRRFREIGSISVACTYASAKLRRVSANNVKINFRLPVELLASLDACASALGATRSALLRGLIEDATDSAELPSAPTTASEAIELVSDDEFERLRELTRD